MNDMQIPPHIDMTRRIAVDLAVSVAKLGDTETQLRAQLDEHQRVAAAERNRIEAELRKIRENADQRLADLAETERRIVGELADVGRRREQHTREAAEANESITDWCTRRAISPEDLPPLTGPIPVIEAKTEPAAEPRPEVVDLAPHVGHDVVLRTFGGTKVGGRLVQAAERAQVRQDDGTDCYVAVTDVAEVMRVAEIAPPPGFDPNTAGTVVATPPPGMTIPDTGLNPPPLPPVDGHQAHRKPGLLDRITGRGTGPQPVQPDGTPGEAPTSEQNGAAK